MSCWNQHLLFEFWIHSYSISETKLNYFCCYLTQWISFINNSLKPSVHVLSQTWSLVFFVNFQFILLLWNHWVSSSGNLNHCFIFSWRGKFIILHLVGMVNVVFNVCFYYIYPLFVSMYIKWWSWSYDSWIYSYLCDQCMSPLNLLESRSWRGVLDWTLCNKVCHWLATGLWFPPPIKLTTTI